MKKFINLLKTILHQWQVYKTLYDVLTKETRHLWSWYVQVNKKKYKNSNETHQKINIYFIGSKTIL